MSAPSSSTTATARIASLKNHITGTHNSNNETQQSAMSANKFQGWVGLGKDAVDGKMVWQEYEPKPWTEDDVEIKITHCGICGSDLHTLRSGWVGLSSPCP
jgi:alcohol dehydrogenase (NADP+)